MSRRPGGIRLEATRDMAELVGVTGLATLPGAQRLSQFMAYLAASPDGASAVIAADRVTRQMLEEATRHARIYLRCGPRP